MKGELIGHKPTSWKQLRNMCRTFFMRFIQTDKLIVLTATGMPSIKTFFIPWRFWLQTHHKLHLKVLVLHVRPCGKTIRKWYQSDSSFSKARPFHESWRCYCRGHVVTCWLLCSACPNQWWGKPQEKTKTHIWHIRDLKKFKSVTSHVRKGVRGLSRFCCFCPINDLLWTFPISAWL